MAQNASATVEVDTDGRLTIPKGARKALGIDGETAYVDLHVRVLGQDTDE